MNRRKMVKETHFGTDSTMLYLDFTATNFAWMSQVTTRACLRLISPKDPSLIPIPACRPSGPRQQIEESSKR